MLSPVVVSMRAEGDRVAQEFMPFADANRLRLQRALVARYGLEIGVEAAADAMAYAWEHWDRVGAMDNPLGYLWRVAQTSVRRHHRWRRPPELVPEIRDDDPAADRTELPAALWSLKPDVRVALLLVHGYEWPYQDVAELLGVPLSTVRNHVHRGLRQLRKLED